MEGVSSTIPAAGSDKPSGPDVSERMFEIRDFYGEQRAVTLTRVVRLLRKTYPDGVYRARDHDWVSLGATVARLACVPLSSLIGGVVGELKRTRHWLAVPPPRGSERRTHDYVFDWADPGVIREAGKTARRPRTPRPTEGGGDDGVTTDVNPLEGALKRALTDLITLEGERDDWQAMAGKAEAECAVLRARVEELTKENTRLSAQIGQSGELATLLAEFTRR